MSDSDIAAAEQIQKTQSIESVGTIVAETAERAEKILPQVEYFHMANSAAVLTFPDAHFNMVRPGISLYGVTPLGKPHDHLLPVMRMKAPVTIIKHVLGCTNVSI